MKRKFAAAAVVADETLGPRQIRLRASTPTPDRAGDVMVPKGCDAKGYAANPIILADHDPRQPIGRAKLTIGDDAVDALIDFAPEGVSAKADEYCGLAKAGILNAGSIGFQPVESEPIKGGGLRYTKWELMEISIVAVPCNPEALVVGRSLENATPKADATWKVGASRGLPIGGDGSSTSSEWDGPAAEASIFEHAGFDGDKPDSTFARKGFLAYDAAKPGEKGSYKLPFAKVVDGRLTAMPSGIRAAASRLPQAYIPDDVAEKARAVIDHYEGKMDKDDADKQARPRRAKAVRKGLWDVACLAELLQRLGYMHDGAVYEESIEQDGSNLPKMLAEALSSLAAAFLAMSEEETRELLEGRGIAVVGEDGVELSAAAPVVKRFGALRAKAGAVLSAENREHRDEALKCLAAVAKCMKAMDGCHEKAAEIHESNRDLMDELQGHMGKAAEHMKALGKKKPKPGEDADEGDEPGATDDSDAADQEGNEELALAAARRKREADVLRLKAR
jgi:HK97 family phage prohead protease